MRLLRAGRVATIVVAAALALPAVAGAATIDVTTTADTVADGGGCSLREAVSSANADDGGASGCTSGSGADTIALPAATLTLSGDDGDDANVSGDLDVTSDIDFDGAGAGLTILDAGLVDRAIDVQDDGAATSIDVTLQRLTIRNGSVLGGADDGGAVLMRDTNGSIAVREAVIESSHAGRDGGALTFRGATNGAGHPVEIVDSELRMNTAGDDGGALFVEQPSGNGEGNSMLVQRSTLATNIAVAGAGGAIYGAATTRLDVVDSTLSDNVSAQGGGAIALGDSNPALVLQFSTVAGNVTARAGGWRRHPDRRRRPGRRPARLRPGRQPRRRRDRELRRGRARRRRLRDDRHPLRDDRLQRRVRRHVRSRRERDGSRRHGPDARRARRQRRADAHAQPGRDQPRARPRPAHADGPVSRRRRDRSARCRAPARARRAVRRRGRRARPRPGPRRRRRRGPRRRRQLPERREPRPGRRRRRRRWATPATRPTTGRSRRRRLPRRPRPRRPTASVPC